MKMEDECMNIAVYCGSSMGNDPAFAEAAREVGAMIGERGDRLIYGGSRAGLMGLVADAVLENGGHVTGVEPRFFLEAGYVHEGIDETIPTETMNERKAKMLELQDACIAIPGGSGTLDEISEAVVMAGLDDEPKPCILYNKKHFYDLLEKFYDQMVENEFLSGHNRGLISFCQEIGEIEAILNTLKR